MKTKILYKATCTVHNMIRWFNVICFLFLTYSFFADFGFWPKLTNDCPWYVAFPVGTFLFRLRFGNDGECPVTTLEKKLKEQGEFNEELAIN